MHFSPIVDMPPIMVDMLWSEGAGSQEPTFDGDQELTKIRHTKVRLSKTNDNQLMVILIMI